MADAARLADRLRTERKLIRRVAIALCLLAAGACRNDDDATRADETFDLPEVTTTLPLSLPTTTIAVAPLATTPTSVVSATADGGFAFPKPGTYTYQDLNEKKTVHNAIATQGSAVRVYSPESRALYVEQHDRDGVWLVSSATSDGRCQWSPRSATLPVAVINGGSVTTTSTCTIGAKSLTLTQTVTFKQIRTVTVAGRALRSIDVSRHRVLSDTKSTITSDAVDTFSFELGVRIATNEQTTTKTASGSAPSSRMLVLVSAPS